MGAPSYKVFVSSQGNVFMREIAGMLAEAIEAVGREVQECGTELPKAEPGVINLVVAPHEYFLLQSGPTEAELVRAAAESVTVGVEQPGTMWFEEGVRYASYGSIALDINPRGVRELQRRGVEAHRLQLGYHRGWDAWHGTEGTNRHTDVLFLGSNTARRTAFLASSASVLTEWNCDLRLFEFTRPVAEGSDHFVTGRRKHERLADTRVLLNVHQGERDYFEWVRVIEAISNGCLVITETSGGFSPLMPSEHFVQAGLDTLIGRVDAFLRDEDLRSEVAHKAYEFTRKHLAFDDIMDRLLPGVERRLATRTRAARPITIEKHLPDSVQRGGRRKPLPPFPNKSKVDVSKSGELAAEQHMRSMIKALLLAEIDNIRSIEALMSAVDNGERVRTRTFDTPAFVTADPQVTVVIPLFNYEQFIREAIESVVATQDVAVELLIVDDHSNDSSVAVVREAMREFASFPIRLLARSANLGLSSTRNCGIEQARANFVFLLDADNTVYPQGIGRLLTALDRSEAAFAYGLIEMYGDSSGLVSCLPWDSKRLTEENYIDAMALIRKSAWASVGGFDPQTDQMGGWEDYDLWLHLAAEGHYGQLVTNFIGRYCTHGSSMLSTVNLETGALRRYFQDKYPHLPWMDEEVLP